VYTLVNYYGIVCESWPDGTQRVHVIRNFTMQSDALIITIHSRGFTGHGYTRCKGRLKFYETVCSCRVEIFDGVVKDLTSAKE